MNCQVFLIHMLFLFQYGLAKHHENDCKSADLFLFLRIKQIQEICENYPSYFEAAILSYNFYQENAFSAPGSSMNLIHDFIAEKVRKYQMDRQF